MTTIVSIIRGLLRRLITKRQSISAAEKLMRGLLLIPPFALLLVLLRVRGVMRGPLPLQADTIDGLRFQCRLPDLIQMYLYLFGIWEPDLTEFIRRCLNHGDVFIDVGANVGYDSLLAWRRVGPGGKVVAIEPSPSVYAQLVENLQLNGAAAQIRCVNKAAAAISGRIDLYSGPQHNIGLTTTEPVRGLPRQTLVEALPLDDLLTLQEIRHARLVKIDVEGGEPAVLAGMKRLIAEGRRDFEILIELSPNWWSDQNLRPCDVLKPFVDSGFNVYQMRNSYWPWRYLWPACVNRPRRVHRELTQRVARLDLVLSRFDAEEL